jgi:hypothetical protein
VASVTAEEVRADLTPQEVSEIQAYVLQRNPGATMAELKAEMERQTRIWDGQHQLGEPGTTAHHAVAERERRRLLAAPGEHQPEHADAGADD